MIAFYVPFIYPCYIGGLEIYYYHLINELSKNDKVILFTNCKTFPIDNCDIIHISSKLFFIRKYKLGYLSLFLSSIFKLIFIYRKISLIHLPCTSNSGFYGYFFPLIKYFFRIPYIIQFHGGAMHPWKRHDGNHLLFNHAARILAVSDSIKIEYEKRSDREIKVILPLIPYSKSQKSKAQLKQKYGFSNEDYIIIMVGSIKPLKGNIWVYDSFISLQKEWIEKHRLKLLYVGKGSEMAKLASMITNDGMTNIVRIIQQVPNESIHEIYELADYYIIGSSFEGTPKSLLEALFHGLPIIGSDIEGITNIITDRYNGILVNRGSSNELKNAIKELISDQELAKFIAHNAAKTYSEKYKYNDMLNQLLRTYQEVLY